MNDLFDTTLFADFRGVTEFNNARAACPHRSWYTDRRDRRVVCRECGAVITDAAAVLCRGTTDRLRPWEKRLSP